MGVYITRGTTEGDPEKKTPGVVVLSQSCHNRQARHLSTMGDLEKNDKPGVVVLSQTCHSRQTWRGNRVAQFRGATQCINGTIS